MISLQKANSSYRSRWLKHGFLNTLEHGVTRGADALSSLVLLWAVSPETFAKLATSQAILAPVLFFFIAPETAIYREYARWRSEGPSALAARLSALRRFAWAKAPVALLLSAAIALFSAGSWSERFWPLIWAFALVLGPQLSGPDREFLRLDLKLETLNVITLYQKLSLLLGTCLVAFLFPSRTDYLAAIAVFSTLSTAIIAAAKVKEALLREGATAESLKGRSGPSMTATISDCLTKFSGWQHVNGIIIGWVQTMDLFFLTLYRFPSYQVGLYAAVLKIANFSIMIPLALSNSFSLWVGRRDGENGLDVEWKQLKRLTGFLAALVIVQSLVVFGLSPMMFKLLSHGRWSAKDQEEMLHWLAPILMGTLLYCSTLIVGVWLPLRSRVSELFFKVYLPWGFISLAVYGLMIWFSPSGEAFQSAANANVFVALTFVVLVLFYLRKLKRS